MNEQNLPENTKMFRKNVGGYGEMNQDGFLLGKMVENKEIFVPLQHDKDMI